MHLDDLYSVRIRKKRNTEFGKRNAETRPRFTVVSLGTRANAELIPKFHVALLASEATLPMVTTKFAVT
jgi:hypothetical protein